MAMLRIYRQLQTTRARSTTLGRRVTINVLFARARSPREKVRGRGRKKLGDYSREMRVKREKSCSVISEHDITSSKLYLAIRNFTTVTRTFEEMCLTSKRTHIESHLPTYQILQRTCRLITLMSAVNPRRGNASSGNCR